MFAVEIYWVRQNSCWDSSKLREVKVYKSVWDWVWKTSSDGKRTKPHVFIEVSVTNTDHTNSTLNWRYFQGQNAITTPSTEWLVLCYQGCPGLLYFPSITGNTQLLNHPPFMMAPTLVNPCFSCLGLRTSRSRTGCYLPESPFWMLQQEHKPYARSSSLPPERCPTTAPACFLLHPIQYR